MLVSRTRLQTAALASRKGMSLVEIMVVIAIIGILMTVVAVNVVGYLDEANVSTTKIQIKNMESALTTYAAKHRGGHGRMEAAAEEQALRQRAAGQGET